MIPSPYDDTADWLRARSAQAIQARQQADHHRRLAEKWDERATAFEADIAAVRGRSTTSDITQRPE